jgi:uncharacterized protein (TIGR00369 family)
MHWSQTANERFTIFFGPIGHRLLPQWTSGESRNRLSLNGLVGRIAAGRRGMRGGMSGKKYGVVPPEVLNSQSGLDFLKAIIAGTVPQAPICETLGFHLVEAETGRAAFEGVPEFRYYNPIGTVHGGFTATLLDSALGCAIFSTLLKGDAWTTLELKINFVRPLTKDTGLVRAEARIIHRGRTVATSEGDLKDRAGKLYAHATTTCMIFPATT